MLVLVKVVGARTCRDLSDADCLRGVERLSQGRSRKGECVC